MRLCSLAVSYHHFGGTSVRSETIMAGEEMESAEGAELTYDSRSKSQTTMITCGAPIMVSS
jgi:hypothetical protein